MKKIFFISFLLICIGLNKSNAQQNPVAPTTHEYYVMVHGINATQDVAVFKGLIDKQPGITSIIEKGSPVKYFIVNSTRVISIQDIKAWISTSTYEFQFITDNPKTKQKLERL